MADQPAMHIAENTPEHIAYRLLKDVMNLERMTLNAEPPTGWKTATRAYVLDTYLECIDAVRGLRKRSD